MLIIRHLYSIQPFLDQSRDDLRELQRVPSGTPPRRQTKMGARGYLQDHVPHRHYVLSVRRTKVRFNLRVLGILHQQNEHHHP